MANLSLRNIYKVYPSRDKGPSFIKRVFSTKKIEQPKDFVAVKDFNLDIADGEFIVFVGPSGCGKSTTLRMIAGLEDITAGEFFMDDVLLNNVDPMNRDMAMVFQSYALYPHLSAYENIAFGLKIRKIKTYVVDKDGKPVMWIDKNAIKQQLTIIKDLKKSIKGQTSLISRLSSNPDNLDQEQFENTMNQLKASIAAKEGNIQKALEEIEKIKQNPTQKYVFTHMPKQEINERVKWAASILNIEELLDRKPSEMSGGQCQRVALGRAIVRGPKVFLLDEPLSNLDAKLRTSMRSEIVKLHQKLKTTFIYVTHDQVEAMTMGTRIVVMESGIIQQVDTPMNIFNYPKNMFVAGFIGTPQMNFFDVELKLEDKNKLALTFSNGETITLDTKKMRAIDPQYLDGKTHTCVLGVRAEHIKISNKGLSVNISISEVLGTTTHLYIHLDGQEKDLIVSTDETKLFTQGEQIHLGFDESKVHLFEKETGISILEGVKE